MKLLIVNITLKDTDKFSDTEMDSYDMFFSDKDIDKAYELFNIIKRGMQKKQYQRDEKEK